MQELPRLPEGMHRLQVQQALRLVLAVVPDQPAPPRPSPEEPLPPGTTEHPEHPEVHQEQLLEDGRPLESLGQPTPDTHPEPCDHPICPTRRR